MNTMSRYDPYDQYYLNSRGYYDNQNLNSNYRGNGYDNTNPKYYEMMRERFYSGKIKLNE